GNETVAEEDRPKAASKIEMGKENHFGVERQANRTQRDAKVNLGLAALAVAGLLVLAACTGTKAAPGPPPPVPVVAATVEQKNVPIRVHAIGTVEAYSTVSVKTQITGELTGVYFKEGEDVRK